MKRDIKFRVFAYTDEGSQMIYLNPLECDNGLWFPTDIHIEDYSDRIMQFTGLKDKNGEEVYEGDIISTCQRKDGSHVCFPVVYDFDGWKLGGDKYVPIRPNKSFWRMSKVIGNIYENPELLTTKQANND